jgi:hypothetical protein
MVLKDARGVVEDVVDNGIEILPRGIRARANPDHEIRSWNRHLDANAMGLSVLVSMMRRLHRDAAMCHAVEKGLELRGSPTDVVFDRRRCLDAAERDLDGDHHVRLLILDSSRSRADAAARCKERGAAPVAAP